jgi:CubicO group peptidase (beta-lactamase class C family)
MNISTWSYSFVGANRGKYVHKRIGCKSGKWRKSWTVILVMIILAAINCSKSVLVPVQEKPAFHEITNKIPFDKASDWSWTTIDGESRHFSEVKEKLKKTMEEFQISGMSIAIAQDPATSYETSAERFIIDLGFENILTHKPIDENTVFQVGRLGQPILGYLVFKLVDDGVFDMNKSLQDFLPKPLPEYPAYRDLEGDSRYRRLTARRILNHCSGLINSRSTRPDGRLVFEKSPGSVFGYSEEGLRLLKFVLEQKFNKSIDALAKSAVYDSLSLKNMGYELDPRFQGHIAAAPGEEAPGQSVKLAPLNSFYSTAVDFNKFMVPVMFEGGRFKDRYKSLPYFDMQFVLNNRTIFAPSRMPPPTHQPPEMGWAFGRVIYSIYGAWLGILGERTQTSEYCALTAIRRWGEMTAVSIFMVGNLRGSPTGAIIKDIMGDVSPPLNWLGF